jgi:hypothetical protein
MFKELAEYCYCKKKAMVIEDAEGNNVLTPGSGMGVMLYIPHNDRDEPAGKVVVRKKV